MSVDEMRAYGYRFPPLNERIERLRETILILKAMWTGKTVSVKGKMVGVINAVSLPKPQQTPGPPIWIGGKHRMILDVVAELAEGWNHWGLSKRKLGEREAYLSTKCAELGRDSQSITRSWAGTISLATQPSNQAKLAESMKTELLSQTNGTTDYFIPSFGAAANRKTYEAFAEAVRSIA
jgi:alkanesulfonate monooxygenase SsuD/methylene tetrahydromethanopterin reductase-like flavin-dependent oxidoreductase (luciferase family)